MRTIKTTLLIGLCLLANACGVKPNDVSAPEGSENTSFPRTYPDLDTDQQPENTK